MKILALISILLVLAYIIYCTAKSKEIPDSISDTAYIGSPKAFTGALCLTAATLFPVLLEEATEGSKWLAFLSIVGILMAGLTPNYKTKDSLIHYTGGILAGISSQALVALNQPNLLYTWAIYPLLYLLNKENSVFWAEIICLITTFMMIL